MKVVQWATPVNTDYWLKAIALNSLASLVVRVVEPAPLDFN
jgi:hypothetical protein